MDDNQTPERAKEKLTKEVYLARLRRRGPWIVLYGTALAVLIRLLRLQGHPWNTGFMLQGLLWGIVIGIVGALLICTTEGRIRK